VRTRTVTLHNSGGAQILSLIVRDNDASVDAPTRNYDAVQPPGSTAQGVFGDGIHRVGILERDFALCNGETYADTFTAKAALDAALEATASIRVDGWELSIAAVQGAPEWVHQRAGLQARIRFIPSSAYWVKLGEASVTALGLL
jgi:hypothetical protein